jgi:hypothetical protein
MRNILPAFGLLLLTGCATWGAFDHSLKVEVKPFPISRGVPFHAEINAPLDATEVVGHAMVPMGPTMVFKKSAKKGRWVFTGTVPKAFYIHPGHFQVRVTVKRGKESPHYTEFQMQLK